MASAFETAMGAVEVDVQARINEATPFAIAIAGALIAIKVAKLLVRRLI